MSKECDSSIFLEECNESELADIINELQNGKASDIPIILIKTASKVICPYLTKLYNNQISLGFFPKILKISIITPVYKNGNKEHMKKF